MSRGTADASWARFPLAPASTLLLLVTCVGAIASPAVAGAQSTTETLDFDRPEAWAMVRLTSLTLLSSLGPPGLGRTAEPGGDLRLRITGEVGWVPALSRQERTVGFYGTKEEDTNKSPVFGRFRVGLSGGAGWSAELAAMPPVEIGGARPFLVAGSVGWSRSLSDVALGIRVHAQEGYVQGDITCPARIVAAGDDLERNPFRCEEPSSDRLHPRYLAASGSIGTTVGRVQPFAELSVIRHRARFEVDALYGGVVDQGVLSTRGTGWSVSGGVAGARIRGVDLVVEAFYSPLTVQRRFNQPRERAGAWNVRLGVSVDPG